MGFSLGAEDSRVFGDHFKHFHSQSAKDLSSFFETLSDAKMNFHIDDIIETTISTPGTNNLVTACPSTSYELPSSVSITLLDVHVLTESGVVSSFVGVSGDEESNYGTGFDVSMNALSQTLDSVKLTPECGIFVSSPPAERWSDLSTSVFSSGCRFTNISSTPTASPNMPPHARTRYTQIVSGMDMTESEHGLYGLVSSNINSGGDFLFKNTSFSHCTTTQKDQAFDQDHPCTDVAQSLHGGALRAFTCNHVELSGTNTFDRCVCRGGAGGGFFIYDTATTLTISGVTCMECWNSNGTNAEGEPYSGYGGGGYLGMKTTQAAAVQITNCEFTGCTSTTTGGLSVNIPWTEISSCEFTSCEGNGRGGGGGLNYFLQGTHSLSFSSFTDCSHLTGVGGGVEFSYRSSIFMESVAFTNCHTLDAQGGGCYLGSEGSAELKDCSFTDCNISLNSPSSGGGALYSFSSTKLHINNTRFVRCKALKGADAMSMGGGLYDDSGKDTRLHLCTFTGCVGGQYGGGASLHGSASVVTNCTFTDCFCKTGGGMDISFGKSTLEYCVFERCSSAKVEGQGAGGGGLFFTANNSALNHLQFKECKAEGVPGAGLLISRCCPQMNDINFTSCQAKKGTAWSYGSGLYGDSLTNAVVTNCNFVSCTSEQQGGGAHLAGPSARIENCTFQLCQSQGIGAALRIGLVSCEIKGCTIDQCTSSTTETAVIFFENTGGSLTITNTNITKSTGTGTIAGVLQVTSNHFEMLNVEISDSTLNRISPAYSAQGGAGYIQTVSSDFSNCRFEKCTSGQRAGALFFTNSGGTLTECTFDTCTAEGGNGGAVEIDGTSSIAFVSCIFTACSSGNGDGGAVWANVIDNTISFSGGSMKLCSATGNGGGIFVSLVDHNVGTVKLENVGFGEDAELNSCAGSGTNIYIHTTTVPSILNPDTLVADYFTTPKNSETNVFDATELESCLFGDKQQNSTSLVFLANPYTGEPAYASGGKFDHELCGNSKLPCAVLDRAHNIAEESSSGDTDATVLIHSDIDLTKNITPTKPITWASSSSQMHTIRTATCTITIESDTFTAHALHFIPTTIQTSPTLFAISGTGSLVLSSSKLSSFTLDGPLIKHEGASVEITGTTIEHITLSATAAIVASHPLTITNCFFNTITSQHKGGSAIWAELDENTGVSVKDTGFVNCVANNVENWVLITGLENRTSLESESWAGTFNHTSEWSGVMVEESAEEGPYSLLYHFYPRPVGSFHVTKSNSSNFRLCGHSAMPCHSLPKSFDVTHEPLAEVREAELNELFSIGDRSLTISGHNKRGVVEMISKGRVLSSDLDDPGTLTFKELTIDVSSSQLTRIVVILHRRHFIVKRHHTHSPQPEGGAFVVESVKIRQIAFAQTPFTLHPNTSTELTLVNVAQCMMSHLLSAEDCSLTLVTCTFSLQQSIDEVNDADEMCTWSTGLLVLDHCTTTLSFPTFDSVAQGAIAMRGGTLNISSGSFSNCSQPSSTAISTRKHIACSEDGMITIPTAWTSDDDSTENLWISTDSCDVTQAGNPVLAPLFVPTIDVNKTKATGGKKSLYNLTLIGTSLYPCDLSLCVWEVSEKKNSEPFVFNLPASVFKSTTTIVADVNISGGSFSSSTVLRGALQYSDGLVTDWFTFRASSSERFSQAFDRNKSWIIPVIVVSAVALLLLLIIVFLVRRHQKKKKQDQPLSSQQEQMMDVVVKYDEDDEMMVRTHGNTHSGLLPNSSHTHQQPNDDTAIQKNFDDEDNEDSKRQPKDLVKAYNCDDDFNIAFVSPKQSLFQRIHHSDNNQPLNSGAILVSVIKGIKYLQSQKQDNLVVSVLTPHHFFLDSSGKVSLGTSDHLRHPDQSTLNEANRASEGKGEGNNHFFRESNIGSVNDNTISLNTLKPSTNAQPVKSTEGQRWMAPEVAGRRTALDVSKAAVFSLGLVLWEMETGSVPFGEVDAVNAQRQLGAGSPLKMDRISSDFVKSLIASCLEVDPHARLSLNELEDKLNTISDHFENKPQQMGATIDFGMVY
ncbi:hypothetical protein BLNAU_5747 [Blattamonas nauphoetae]|uniref:Protein kinase domain-containing protein n=1 Tax=Blattamonas nauphoetae TaxID=2049346 RepID=A0ABQ9Y653_9EUKA|nr:hypothetical protein BLNAU_5747 [Blattamonas nauphoetae]